MNIVGAVSRAGEPHSVLFCEYTGSESENQLVGSFLEGINVALKYENIYCIAVYSLNGEIGKAVGIYYHKDGVECMVYDRPYDYLSDYVADIFADELKEVLGKDKGGTDSDAASD